MNKRISFPIAATVTGVMLAIFLFLYALGIGEITTRQDQIKAWLDLLALLIGILTAMFIYELTKPK